MVLVFAANLITSYHGNREAVDSAYDRVLLASASAIAERTAVREDSVWVDIPYAALKMLASTAQDRIFYTVSAPGGQVITGYEDLPLPPESTGRRNLPTPYFYDAVYKGAPVRVVSLRTFVIGNNLSGFATIRVAQTRGEREALTLSLLSQSVIWTLVIAVSGGFAAWLGISLGLRPLDHLREALGRRCARRIPTPFWTPSTRSIPASGGPAGWQNSCSVMPGPWSHRVSLATWIFP